MKTFTNTIIAIISKLAQEETHTSTTGEVEEKKKTRRAEHHSLKRLETVLARIVVEVDYAPC